MTTYSTGRTSGFQPGTLRSIFGFVKIVWMNVERIGLIRDN